VLLAFVVEEDHEVGKVIARAVGHRDFDADPLRSVAVLVG
jgi:hypothetical protein